MMEYKLKDFDYHLPQELIAQEPLPQRDESKMMVLRRGVESFEHSIFKRLSEYLNPGDLLILNNTRVIPARLLGRRRETGGEAELLLLHRLEETRWTAMVRPGRKLKPGTEIEFSGGLQAVVEDYTGEGKRIVHFSAPGLLEEDLTAAGNVPLPPYITARLQDPERYQTVYAEEEGSAAAPTAGFHFTAAVFDELRKKGIDWRFFTLHIGPGTFQPVKTDDIREHKMHEEYFRLPEDTARDINEAKKRGNRIVAVGTTACRVLETAAKPDGTVSPREGWTGIYIYPGYRFRAVDALLTNFHLPCSTLIMLVSALAGHSTTMAAYQEAVRERYRFYSFGDCMLIL